MTRNTTQVAVLTAAGRGAVAVIAVAGPRAVSTVNRYFLAVNGRLLLEQPLHRIVYGHWGDRTGEDLIVCRRETEVVEIHCHGGAPSIAQVVEDLVCGGCIQSDWQHWIAEWSECPLAAEAHVALAEASTLRTAAILLDQYQGALREELVKICQQLREGSVQRAAERLQELLAYAELGRHLTRPWQVVLAGLPNVGKSSLINALVGYSRAIVFDQPGTTRDVVSATTAAHGWPLRLSDTAGLHMATDELENAGIVQTHHQLQEADLVLWVLDASQIKLGREESGQEIARQQASKVGANCDWSRDLVVVNKIDLLPEAVSFRAGNHRVLRLSSSLGQEYQGLLGEHACAAHTSTDLVTTCAITKEGVAGLLNRLANRLVPHSPSAGAAVPFSVRQVAQMQEALAHGKRGQAVEAEAALKQLLFWGA